MQILIFILLLQSTASIAAEIGLYKRGNILSSKVGILELQSQSSKLLKLRQAIQAKDLAQLHFLVKAYPGFVSDINIGSKLLEMAVDYDNSEAAKLFSSRHDNFKKVGVADRLLERAIEWNDCEMVKTSLSNGALISNKAKSILKVCIDSKDERLFINLVQNMKFNEISYAVLFQKAIALNSAKLGIALIHSGAKVSGEKDQLLRLAITRNHYKLTSELLKQGAVPELDSISWAIQHRNPDLATLLLKHGAKMASSTLKLYEMSLNNDELFQILAEKCFNEKSCGLLLKQSLKYQRYNHIKQLTLNLNNLDNLNGLQDKILIMAFFEKDQELLKKCVELGADLNKPVINGATLVIYSIETMQSIGMLQFLLENGASPNRMDDSNRTPLQVAATSQDVFAYTFILIQNGADFNVKGSNFKNAIENFEFETNREPNLVEMYKQTIEAALAEKQQPILLDDECSVCLESLDHSKVSTICKHEFHEGCIQNWMSLMIEKQRNLKCPNCQREFETNIISSVLRPATNNK